MTVAEGAEAYAGHLEASGKSPSTCATTRRTLALLVAHLGADREVVRQQGLGEASLGYRRSGRITNGGILPYVLRNLAV